jgi:outer membrane murein-binding lipoprotein Lpp
LQQAVASFPALPGRFSTTFVRAIAQSLAARCNRLARQVSAAGLALLAGYREAAHATKDTDNFLVIV